MAVSYLLLVTAGAARAQVVTDPSDPLYTDLEVWEAKGLLGRLPALQPYPQQLVEHLLRDVADNEGASPSDRRRARWLASRIGDPLHFTLETNTRWDAATQGRYSLMAIDFDVQGMVIPWLGASIRGRFMAVHLDHGLALPAGRGNPEDFVSDASDFDIGTENRQARQASYGSVGIGEGDAPLLFQLGFGRHRIGPFYDNGIVVGPQAAQAGQFAVLLRQELFTVHTALFELSATDDAGAGRGSGKHLFYHGIDVHLLPWLDVGAFETVVSGGRLELLYFIPVVAYFHSQGLTGFADNSLVGLVGRATPLTGVDVKGQVYFDDLSFNDMVRGRFDTKYKLAAQLGVAIAPAAILDPQRTGSADAWRFVTVDYTAVMPYMYTHANANGAELNYENYTNAGSSLGPALEPNSDRLQLRALWRPLDDPSRSFVDVEVRGAVIRHGNASAGIIAGRDGSIFDDGFLDGTATFQPPFVDPTGQPATRFLSQAVVEQTLQLGASVLWTLDDARAGHEGWQRGFGGLTAVLGYTAQWQENAGLRRGVVRQQHFLEASLRYRY